MGPFGYTGLTRKDEERTFYITRQEATRRRELENTEVFKDLTNTVGAWVLTGVGSFDTLSDFATAKEVYISPTDN